MPASACVVTAPFTDASCSMVTLGGGEDKLVGFPCIPACAHLRGGEIGGAVSHFHSGSESLQGKRTVILHTLLRVSRPRQQLPGEMMPTATATRRRLAGNQTNRSRSTKELVPITAFFSPGTSRMLTLRRSARGSVHQTAGLRNSPFSSLNVTEN